MFGSNVIFKCPESFIKITKSLLVWSSSTRENTKAHSKRAVCSGSFIAMCGSEESCVIRIFLMKCLNIQG